MAQLADALGIVASFSKNYDIIYVFPLVCKQWYQHATSDACIKHVYFHMIRHAEEQEAEQAPLKNRVKYVQILAKLRCQVNATNYKHLIWHFLRANAIRQFKMQIKECKELQECATMIVQFAKKHPNDAEYLFNSWQPRVLTLLLRRVRSQYKNTKVPMLQKALLVLGKYVTSISTYELNNLKKSYLITKEWQAKVKK